MDYATMKMKLDAKRAERDAEIRRRHMHDGMSLAELGRLYQISRERVRQICYGNGRAK